MDDLISRQAAIDALAEQIALCDKALNLFGISMKDEYAVKVEKASLVAYKEQLEFIPATDVVPVVHARWWHYDGMYTCEACGETLDDKSPYCPMCGAKVVEQ